MKQSTKAENSHVFMCDRSDQFAISNETAHDVQINGADAALVMKMTEMT